MSFHLTTSNVSPKQKNAIYASAERGLCSGISSAYLAYERGNSLKASLITGFAVGIFQQASEFALNLYAVEEYDSSNDKPPKAPPHFFTLPKLSESSNLSKKTAYNLNTLLRTSALAALIGPRGAIASNWKNNIAQQVMLTSFKPIFNRFFYNVLGKDLNIVMGSTLNAGISTAFNATLNPGSSSLSELAKSFFYYSNQESSRNSYGYLDPNTIDPYVHDCLHMLCFDGLSQLKNLI